MKKPFSILQLRIHLQALYAEAITFSKLVEILNETAANPTRHQWVSFTDEQPADGQKIILQYKTFAFDNVQYDASVADYYTANCLRWLNQKGKENDDVLQERNSEQLPPITNDQHKQVMKALYPADRSKRFRQ